MRGGAVVSVPRSAAGQQATRLHQPVPSNGAAVCRHTSTASHTKRHAANSKPRASSVCIYASTRLLTLGRSVFFFAKQVFGPRTAKSLPIWIEFCTHLLLYGIHLWADLDHDRRLGGSRSNQNDYVFCNTCNAP